MLLLFLLLLVPFATHAQYEACSPDGMALPTQSLKLAVQVTVDAVCTTCLAYGCNACAAPRGDANNLWYDASCTNVSRCQSGSFNVGCGTPPPTPPTPPTTPHPPTPAPTPYPPATPRPPATLPPTVTDHYSWAQMCPWAVDALTECERTRCFIPALDAECGSVACHLYCTATYTNASCVATAAELCSMVTHAGTCPYRLCTEAGYSSYVINPTTVSPGASGSAAKGAATAAAVTATATTAMTLVPLLLLIL